MTKDAHEQHDQRPDVAKDDDHDIRKKAKDHWKNAEDTLSEGPAGDPNATDQSRQSS